MASVSRMFAPLGEGVKRGTDLSALVTGRLVGVDPVSMSAQVTVHDSEPLWVPAAPAIYTEGGLVRILRSPLDGGRVTYCLGPLDYVVPLAKGKVTAVNSEDKTLTVDVLGASHVLPFNASTYTAGQVVNVLRDPAGFGQPYMVSGPEGVEPDPDPLPPPPPPPPPEGVPNPPKLESRQVLIGPQWTGSWQGSRWDSWNPNRPEYGGRAALYQGQGYGSPPMSGLAVYGDQIVNLGAVSIQRMLLTVKRAAAGSGTGGSGGPKTAIVQASPHGTPVPGGGPGGSGPTAAVPVAAGQVAEVDLPSSMFEGFRTGASKGLALVGSEYMNLLGTTDASGMILTVQFQVLR